MAGESTPALAHRAVIASIVVAALSVTAFSLVGIAYFLGWIEPRAAQADKIAAATVPAPSAAKTERPEPLMPTYKPPTPPAPAPLPAPAPEATEPKRRPSPPSYANAPTTQPRERTRSRRECDECGTVAAVTTFGGMWEVRVRGDDGRSINYRFRSRPPFTVGERVRMEDGFLVPE